MSTQIKKYLEIDKLFTGEDSIDFSFLGEVGGVMTGSRPVIYNLRIYKVRGIGYKIQSSDIPFTVIGEYFNKSYKTKKEVVLEAKKILTTLKFKSQDSSENKEFGNDSVFEDEQSSLTGDDINGDEFGLLESDELKEFSDKIVAEPIVTLEDSLVEKLAEKVISLGDTDLKVIDQEIREELARIGSVKFELSNKESSTRSNLLKELTTNKEMLAKLKDSAQALGIFNEAPSALIIFQYLESGRSAERLEGIDLEYMPLMNLIFSMLEVIGDYIFGTEEHLEKFNSFITQKAILKNIKDVEIDDLVKIRDELISKNAYFNKREEEENRSEEDEEKRMKRVKREVKKAVTEKFELARDVMRYFSEESKGLVDFGEAIKVLDKIESKVFAKENWKERPEEAYKTYTFRTSNWGIEGLFKNIIGAYYGEGGVKIYKDNYKRDFVVLKAQREDSSSYGNTERGYTLDDILFKTF